MSELADNEQYFIRRRGRVSGPFDYGVIEKMARNNKLYKTDELSIDQYDWVNAAQTDFFPKSQTRVGRSATDKNEASKSSKPGVEIEDGNDSYGLITPGISKPVSPSSIPPMNKEWYYALSDQSFGPVSENELKMQFMMKSLNPNTKIWSAGMTDWVEAKNYPSFALIIQNQNDEKPVVTQTNSSSGILQGKYCIGCGAIIAHEAINCPKCGSLQGSSTSKVTAKTIKTSYLLTFFFPIAGFVYFIYFLVKEEIGHAIGNLILAFFAIYFWPAFIIGFIEAINN